MHLVYKKRTNNSDYFVIAHYAAFFLALLAVLALPFFIIIEYIWYHIIGDGWFLSNIRLLHDLYFFWLSLLFQLSYNNIYFFNLLLIKIREVFVALHFFIDKVYGSVQPPIFSSRFATLLKGSLFVNYRVFLYNLLHH